MEYGEILSIENAIYIESGKKQQKMIYFYKTQLNWNTNGRLH